MNRTVWAVCILSALLTLTVWAQSDLDGTMEGEGYFVKLKYPGFTLHPRYPNRTVLDDFYTKIEILSIDVGPFNSSSGGSYQVSQSYAAASLRSNFTVTQDQVSVQLDGGVSATKKFLQVENILPNGAKLVVAFELYDKKGSFTMATNVVQINPNRLKYTAYISNWPGLGPNDRVRVLLACTFATGTLPTPPPPFPERVDWDTDHRHLVVSWPSVGPLSEVVLDCDVWAVADGEVGIINILPNPFDDFSYLNLSTSSHTATFGFLLPHFTNELLWDPNVLMSLISPDPTPTGKGRNTSNFERNRAIIAACVTVGVILIVVGIIVGVILFRRRNASRRQDRLHKTDI